MIFLYIFWLITSIKTLFVLLVERYDYLRPFNQDIILSCFLLLCWPLERSYKKCWVLMFKFNLHGHVCPPGQRVNLAFSPVPQFLCSFPTRCLIFWWFSPSILSRLWRLFVVTLCIFWTRLLAFFGMGLLPHHKVEATARCINEGWKAHEMLRKK